MKTVKLHIPQGLEYLFDEARPELKEDNASFSISREKEEGQVASPISCPYIKDCIVRFERRHKCKKFKECQSYKFYERYGKNYDVMFI